MAKKIYTKAEDILNKEFSLQFRGYVPEEVDAFLDQIMADFKSILEIEEYYETQNKALQKSNSILRNKMDDLETQIELERAKKNTQPSLENNASNLDLIRKIAHLESELFQTKKELEQFKN